MENIIQTGLGLNPVVRSRNRGVVLLQGTCPSPGLGWDCLQEARACTQRGSCQGDAACSSSGAGSCAVERRWSCSRSRDPPPPAGPGQEQGRQHDQSQRLWGAGGNEGSQEGWAPPDSAPLRGRAEHVARPSWRQRPRGLPRTVLGRGPRLWKEQHTSRGPAEKEAPVSWHRPLGVRVRAEGYRLGPTARLPLALRSAHPTSRAERGAAAAGLRHLRQLWSHLDQELGCSVLKPLPWKSCWRNHGNDVAGTVQALASGTWEDRAQPGFTHGMWAGAAPSGTNPRPGATGLSQRQASMAQLGPSWADTPGR